MYIASRSTCRAIADSDEGLDSGVTPMVPTQLSPRPPTPVRGVLTRQGVLLTFRPGGHVQGCLAHGQDPAVATALHSARGSPFPGGPWPVHRTRARPLARCGPGTHHGPQLEPLHLRPPLPGHPPLSKGCFLLVRPAGGRAPCHQHLRTGLVHGPVARQTVPLLPSPAPTSPHMTSAIEYLSHSSLGPCRQSSS